MAPGTRCARQRLGERRASTVTRPDAAARRVPGWIPVRQASVCGSRSWRVPCTRARAGTGSASPAMRRRERRGRPRSHCRSPTASRCGTATGRCGSHSHISSMWWTSVVHCIPGALRTISAILLCFVEITSGLDVPIIFPSTSPINSIGHFPLPGPLGRVPRLRW